MKRYYLLGLYMFATLFFYFSCNHKVDNQKLESKGLSSYLNPSIVNDLDKTVDRFNDYLEERYNDVEEKKRIEVFLKDYTKMFTSIDSVYSKSMIHSFGFFKQDVDSLSSDGFFNTMDGNYSEIALDAMKWRAKIMYPNEENNIDSLKYFNYMYNGGVGVDYYYAMDMILDKNDSISKKWIEAKIFTGVRNIGVGYIETLPNDYLNSSICKVLVFTEYILPYYNTKEQRFTYPPATASF